MDYQDELTIYEIKIIEILINNQANIITPGTVFVWPIWPYGGMITIYDEKNNEYEDYLKISHKLIGSLYNKGLLYKKRMHCCRTMWWVSQHRLKNYKCFKELVIQLAVGSK